MTERPILNQHPARAGQEALKILIVDAHPLMRAGLANVLAGLTQRVDVLQADSLEGALARSDAHADTALVLLDLIMPDGDGTSVLERVHAAHPEIPDRRGLRHHRPRDRHGGHPQRRDGVHLQAVGAPGAVGRAPPGARRRGVRPARGAPDAAPGAAGGAPSAAPVSARERARGGKELDLTKRQLDVLALLVQGKPNKVICRELGLAEGTVKAHTAAIFRALRVSNRTEAGFAVSCLGIQIPASVGSPGTEPHSFAARRLLAAA